ncbi:unnamed protein product [Pylaiella littoralis]
MPQQRRIATIHSRRRAPLAVLGSSLLLAGTASAQQIVVATPAFSKEAGQGFTLGFSYSASRGTTGDMTGYSIELRSHTSSDATTGCGDAAVSSLCTLDEMVSFSSSGDDDGGGDGYVCVDSDGTYDVTIPTDTAAGMYSIKVSLAADPTVFGCTDAFQVTAEETAVGITVVAGEPALRDVAVEAVTTVLSPGSPFTARWSYDDGAGAGGGSEGTFGINLNACGDDGGCDGTGCGISSTSLCPDDGCYDPGTGDFDVLVPLDLALGLYKLEVVSSSDSSVRDCSASALTVAEGASSADTPSVTPTQAPSIPALPTFSPEASSTGAPVVDESNPSPPTGAAVTTVAPVAAGAAAPNRTASPTAMPSAAADSVAPSVGVTVAPTSVGAVSVSPTAPSLSRTGDAGTPAPVIAGPTTAAPIAAVVVPPTAMPSAADRIASSVGVTIAPTLVVPVSVSPTAPSLSPTGDAGTPAPLTAGPTTAAPVAAEVVPPTAVPSAADRVAPSVPSVQATSAPTEAIAVTDSPAAPLPPPTGYSETSVPVTTGPTTAAPVAPIVVPPTAMPSSAERVAPSVPATAAPTLVVAVTPSPTTAAPLPSSPAPTAAATSAAPVPPAPTPAPSAAATAAVTSAPAVPTTAAPVASAPVAAPVMPSSSGEAGSPGFPPTPVPAKVECDSSAELTFTYTEETTKRPLITVAHASGDREEAGCLTLTMLYDWLATEPTDVPTGMLYTVDTTTEFAVESTTAEATGVWLLDTSIEVTNGVIFEIKGTGVGGDCDELKLSSTVKKWNRVMGYGGNLDIESTYIRSWDAEKSKDHIFKDSDDGSSPRSFLNCVSEVCIAFPDEDCEGTSQNDMGECRMDIIDSTVAYLGYDETESYGISWKVRGLCNDVSNAETLFEAVRVYGDLKNSDIYGMWYGMYSYGHLGGVWTDNLMHDNHVYGFDPHDDSDYLTISGNTCYDNGNHGIIASKRCDHLLLEDNISYNNLGSGIMLHKSSDDSIVRNNDVYSNFDAGLSLVETSRCVVTGNTFKDNRWGVRVILGSTDNVINDNIFFKNTYSDIYSYYGAVEEEPEVEPLTGINTNNVYSYNNVTYTVQTTVDIETSDGTELIGNTFTGTTSGVHFVFLDSTETHVVDNIGDAASGENDDITNSCFTPESNRLPLC